LVCFFKNFESWESEITEEDRISYEWEETESAQNFDRQFNKENTENYSKKRKQYSEQMNNLMKKETDQSLEAYKLTALEVLGLKKPDSNANL